MISSAWANGDRPTPLTPANRRQQRAGRSSRGCRPAEGRSALHVDKPAQLPLAGAALERAARQAEAAGQLKRGARETAQALWAGGHGVVSLMITKPYFDWAPRDVLVETVMDALFEGLFRE